MKKIALLVGFAFLLTFTIVSFLPESTPGALDIWMLNVGQGESVFIHEPDGTTILFDGGPDDSILEELGNVLPPWQHTINLVILSHPHADHIRGLIDVLQHYQVQSVWSSGSVISTADFRTWIHLLTSLHTPVIHVHAYFHQTIGVADLEVYHPLIDMTGQQPKETHDGDVSVKITYENFSIFLAGDLNEKHENDMLTSCLAPNCSLAATILQIPHHGSVTGLAPAFLQAVNPQAALIPVGLNNTFGHPRQEIIAKLTAAHIPIFRTDTQKRIHVIYKDDQVDISTETGQHVTFEVPELFVPP